MIMQNTPFEGAGGPSGEEPPLAALKKIRNLAINDTVGGRAARNILRWLWASNGGIEMRVLDAEHRAALLEIIAWWSAPVYSHAPLSIVINGINAAWPLEECPMCRRRIFEKG